MGCGYWILEQSRDFILDSVFWQFPLLGYRLVLYRDLELALASYGGQDTALQVDRLFSYISLFAHSCPGLCS
jgi:hypothetical protein